jgi:hypothetical protein
MNTTEYLNTPIKSCDNCAYRRGRGEYARCARSGYYCSTERQCHGNCDKNFSGWRQVPPPQPRRSLRAWIRDLLWA